MPSGISFLILANETDVANEVRPNNREVIVSRQWGSLVASNMKDNDSESLVLQTESPCLSTIL
jgi:hypothetical protein